MGGWFGARGVAQFERDGARTHLVVKSKYLDRIQVFLVETISCVHN